MYFFFSRIMYWVFYNQIAIILVLIFFYLLNKNKKIELFLRKFLLAYILIVVIFPTGTLMCCTFLKVSTCIKLTNLLYRWNFSFVWNGKYLYDR